MSISRPCATCSITIRVTSLAHKYCGDSCAELGRRREAAASDPKSDDFFPVTAEQRAAQKRLLSKKLQNQPRYL